MSKDINEKEPNVIESERKNKSNDEIIIGKCIY